ncbi:N-6 DNA methylase [Reinekea blandensis]|nr:N-6 DNA methylase [Reinekea blandensis]
MHVLTKTLVSIHNQFGYSSIQYFDWFLDDCLASFGRKITNPPPESCIPVLFELGKQYAEMVIEADPFSDLLGLVYMELGSEYGKKRMGQFFTPDAVSTMCAEMTAPYSLTEPDRLHTLLEPASGAGSMLLVYVRVWLSRFHRVDNLGVYAVDLDSLCARMTALQLLSNCLVHPYDLGEIVVYQGNALADPDCWCRIVLATLPAHFERSDERVSAITPQLAKAQIDRVSTSEDQLGLFA